MKIISARLKYSILRRKEFASMLISLAVFFIPVNLSSQTKNSGNSSAVKPRTEESMETDDYIEARERFRYQQRASENGEIPPNALIRAKEQVDAMRQRASMKAKVRSPLDAGIWNWEWLGPGDIGGRIGTILISPDNSNTIWIGSVTGGIWRTDNAGASWYPVDDFMATLAVTSLVMDPTNHNVLYAATGVGREGAGLFKSIDGGTTWSQLASTNNDSLRFIYKLAHHPSAPNTFIAIANNRAVRTTDGGTTWITLLPNLTYPTITQPIDVAYHPTNANRILIGGVNDMYYSSDGGATWVKQTTGLPMLPEASGDCLVAFARTNTYMYVSLDRGSGQVWRSTNDGASWDSMNTGSNYVTQGGVNAIWVDPTNPNVLVVGGLDLWSSNNGGLTLTKISNWNCFPDCGGIIHSAHADQHIIVSDPNYNGTSDRIVYVGNDGGIQVFTDIYHVDAFGDGWGNLANNLGITQFYGGATEPNGSVIVGGAQDNGQPRYTPQGGINGWNYPKGLGDGGFAAVDYNNPSYVYGEYVYLQIERSNDGGATYAYRTSGLGDANIPPHSLFISPFVLDPNDPTILVAGGTSIWRTTDRAENWVRIRDSLGMPSLTPHLECSAIDIANGNSSIIWVGYANGTVSRTTDMGATWLDVNNNPTPLPPRYVTDIAINPYDANEVFVTFGGYSPDDVWRTTNSGNTWERRTGTGLDTLPALQVNTIRFHPVDPNWIYIGTDIGVFASEDKGITWSTTPLYGTNEGPVNVEVDELFWQGYYQLIAATYGRGMFRCQPIPVVYVDVANSTPPGTGTPANPYNKVMDGINAAGPGTTITIKGGNYIEAPVTFSKRGRVILTNGNGPVIIH